MIHVSRRLIASAKYTGHMCILIYKQQIKLFRNIPELESPLLSENSFPSMALSWQNSSFTTV